MSASREKKQRQGAGPSNQEILAQEKAAAYKNKVRHYTIIGVVIAVLVVLLLVWNSGLIQRNQTAATVGSTEYSVNDVNYFYQSAKYNTNYIYYMYGMTPPADDAVMNEETGETYRDYYLEQTMASLTELTALYDDAVSAGYNTADVADTVSTQIKEAKEYASTMGYSYSAFLKAQYGRYMTPAAYKSILTKSALVDLYYTDYSDTLVYDDSALEAYYEENKDSLDTFDYSYLYFVGEDIKDENLSEAEIAELELQSLAQMKILAEKAFASVQDGVSLAELAETHPDAKLGENIQTVGGSLSSVYGEELKKLAEGESVLVENKNTGFYVITLNSRGLSDKTAVDVRHILINAETTTNEAGAVVAPSEEAWNTALTEIEKVKAEYLSGDKSEESFAALAEKYSTDGGSNTNGGLYTGVTQGNFVAEFDSWLFDQTHNVGDVEIIKHAAAEDDGNKYYGYHLAYYAGENLVWKNTASSALRSTDLTEWVDSLMANYESCEYTAAVKYVAE